MLKYISILVLSLMSMGCATEASSRASDGHQIVYQKPRPRLPGRPQPYRQMHRTEEGKLLPATHDR